MKNISVKKNAIANYIGQFYVMAISILVTPFYLRYMGTEAYGLVGFFALLQIWFNMLDMGLSPSFGREVSRLRLNKQDFEKLIFLLKSIESYFLVLSLITILLFFTFNTFIAEQWINSKELPLSTIEYCIFIMGVIIVLRWFSILYKSAVNSMEDQQWMNVVNIIMATLRFLGALLILIFVTNSIERFFEYQLLIYLLELMVLFFRFYNIAFFKKKKMWVTFNLGSVKTILPFALGIAYSTILWTFIRQFDKLLLSGILSLSDFAYFSIVILIMGSITALSTPIFLAALPRLTLYYNDNLNEKMLSLYKDMSQVTTWIIMTVVAILSIFSKEVIFILTANEEAALWCANIMPWYIIGSGFIVLGTFQYYLQNVYGNLKLYVQASTIFFLIQIPLSYYFTTNFGAIGAAKLWFVISLLWFLILTPIVHNKFVPGFHFKWFKELLYLLINITVVSYLIFEYIKLDMLNMSTIEILIKIGLAYIGLALVTALNVSRVRNLILNRLKRK